MYNVKEFSQGLGYQLEKSPYDPKFVKKIKESEKGPFYEINIVKEESGYSKKFVKKINKSMDEAERGGLTEIDIEEFFK